MLSKISTFLLSFALLSSCAESKKANGEELAKVYCSGCHTFPSPSLLPSSIWENSILPKMALRLGIGDTYSAMNEYETEELVKIIEMGIFPPKPLISKEDYEAISAYYISNSPQTFRENQKTMEQYSELFKEEIIPIAHKNIIATQFIENKLWVGTRQPNYVFSYNNKLKEIEKNSCESPTIMFGDVKAAKARLEIGKMDPTDLSRGSLQVGQEKIIEELKRPVYFLKEDLNFDQKEDWVICNFGNEQGNLSVYDGESLNQTVISNTPGARIVYYLDINNDKSKELVGLFTQSSEQITAFEQQDNGEYKATRLLEFPPVHGSSYFELKDFNSDGKLDIIMTNGDNADLSPIFKPFHGVRIFLNKGNNKFTESFFYPINGASKVLSQDLDLDGDLDFVVISFFPKENMNEGFLYFENQNGNYIPKAIKSISNKAWLTMDVADFDADGDYDLVLGSYNRTLSKNHLSKNTNNNLILLRNDKVKK